MKTFAGILKRSILPVMLSLSAIVNGQAGLTGSWKHVSQSGEMTMQIDTAAITINGQVFPYKTEGNVLMVNEGIKTTSYTYMLDCNNLSIRFPDGMVISLTRTGAESSSQVRPPQGVPNPYAGFSPGLQSRLISGRWVFIHEQGELLLEFLSASQLRFNGETTRYQLKEGIIQAMVDNSWIDYPYTLQQDVLSIRFPDGTVVPFKKASPSPVNQENITRQGTGGQPAGQGTVWQLQGTLCSWSGSSNSYSSYSGTQKIIFDGQGRFQYGTEAGFSSYAGMAYTGSPKLSAGTYQVGEYSVTLRFSDGSVYEVEVRLRQDNGMITELMYNGTLYAKGLCE